MGVCSRANPGSLGVFSVPCNGGTIGSSTSLYDTYTVLPCSPDISSEFQLTKGWKFSMLTCILGHSSWSSSPKSVIHHFSQFPQDPSQNTTSWKAIISPPCVICSTSWYYLSFLFHKGCTWWATTHQCWKRWASSYLGTHLTMTAALCWCSHQHYINITENHQFILTPSLYNMALRKGYIN